MKKNPTVLKFSKVFGLAGLLALSVTSTQAADRFWSGGTASYNNAASWGGTLPGGGDNAINNSGAGNTVLIGSSDPNWTVNDIRSGDGGGNSGPWLQSGANVTLNGWFRIGIGGGTGQYTLTGGNLNVNADSFNVGEGGTAVFDMTGGVINKNGGGHLAVPNAGTGTFNQTNGLVNIISGELWVGQAAGANGTYNLVSNGVITVNSWVAVGRDGGTGTLNIKDNASITKTGSGTSFIIGASGPGTLNQTGGAVTNNSSDSWLGEAGAGIWNLSGGVVNVGFLQFGRNGGSSGTFNLDGGILGANQIAVGGGSATLNFNGGTLRALSSTATFMTGVPGFLQAGGAVIDSQNFDVSISSALADGAGGSLTKVGNGTLTLSGANTYIGSTVVSAGKLIEGTASLVTTPVTVANTAGYGVSLAVANGQVSHSTVTLSGPANTLNFVLGAFGNPTVAPLNVTSALSVNGTTTVNISDSLPQVGPIPLVSYVSRTGVGNFVLGTLPAGVSATIRTNTTDYANPTIELVISSTALIRWDGEVAGSAWDTSSVTNWTSYLTGLPASFTTGAAVFFDDLALGSTNVNLNVAVSPGSVTVTNDSLGYTITGTGSINGTTGLIKQGTNSLTIATTNGYSGVTTISGGTVSITKLADAGAPSAIGTASTFVLDGGTLSYSGPAITTDRGYSLTRSSTLDAQSDMIFNGPIALTAGANFTKAGNGTLRVTNTGVNTLSLGGGGAAYLIQNGTLILDGSAGPQVNNINGEIWPGGTAASTGGNLILTNTTLNLSSWLAIARGTGTSGYTSSVSMYNSALKSVNFSMAFDGGIFNSLQTALLTLNGNSTFTNNGDSNIGESAGGNSIVTLNDSSVFSGNNRMMIGWHNDALSGTYATGTVTVANSARIVVNSWLSIGNEGGVGTLLVKDNANVTCGDLNITDVNTGSGTLVAKDNATVNAGNMWVGKGAGSVGYLLASNNAAILSNNGLTLGQGALSVATVDLVTGSSLSVNLLQGTPAIGSFSTVNFNGGKVIAHPPYFGPDFIFNLDAANVLAGGAVIEINSNDVRGVSQALLDGGTGGGLSKLGTGTLLLNGINTYTGSTVASSGGLGGNGTIAGNVTINSTATLTPSASAGINTLTIGGNLTIAGNVEVAVNATNTPATNDFVVVAGTLNKTGTGTLKVTNLGPSLNAGDSFTLFSKPVVGGASLTVSGAGIVWTNKLAVDGSIAVVSFLSAPTVTSGGVSVLPNGNVTLTATGAVGAPYTLLGSTNLLTPLASWQVITSGTVTTSPFTVTDTTASGSAQKFYIFRTP